MGPNAPRVCSAPPRTRTPARIQARARFRGPEGICAIKPRVRSRVSAQRARDTRMHLPARVRAIYLLARASSTVAE